MAIPASGPISLFYCMREVNSKNRSQLTHNGSTTYSENYDYDNNIVDMFDFDDDGEVDDWNAYAEEITTPKSVIPISLKDASSGEIDTINTQNSYTNRPNSSAPYALSEFYNYDHNKMGGMPDN